MFEKGDTCEPLVFEINVEQLRPLCTNYLHCMANDELKGQVGITIEENIPCKMILALMYDLVVG